MRDVRRGSEREQRLLETRAAGEVRASGRDAGGDERRRETAQSGGGGGVSAVRARARRKRRLQRERRRASGELVREGARAHSEGRRKIKARRLSFPGFGPGRRNQ